MPGHGRKDKGLRLVVLTEAEHSLIVHVFKRGLEDGYLGEPTRQVLEVLEHARKAPTRRRTAGWLARWRESPADATSLAEALYDVFEKLAERSPDRKRAKGT